jgi:hypothetical protein
VVATFDGLLGVLEPHVPTEADVVPDAELLDACEEGRRQARRQEARNAALLAEIDRRQSYGAARLPVDDGVCTDGHPERAWARSGGSSRPLKTGLNAPLSASVRKCHPSAQQGGLGAHTPLPAVVVVVEGTSSGVRWGAPLVTECMEASPSRDRRPGRPARSDGGGLMADAPSSSRCRR